MMEFPMPKKPLSKREAHRREQARRRLLGRILTVGLLALGVALVVWIVVSSLPERIPNPPVPTQGGDLPTLVGTKQYSSAPPFLIDVNKKYFATVKMAKGGEFVIELYPKKAPITVNNFVFLARNGYYDGVTFHRVLEGFVAQTGDPTGTGMGGPGYQFVNELNDLKFDKAGVVAMANAGPNTNGSQFFITFGPVNLQESDYTIFGQVIEGMDVVNQITRRDPEQTPDFLGDVIETIIITEEE
jgi:cyclophilin family peptidyl-prolyl cis-trans isomerase